MRFRALLSAACFFAFATLAAAQSKPADAISGTWTGDMGPNETERHPIAVTLKFDGKTITGLVRHPQNPGDVKGGAFDPKTGALRLDIVVRDDNQTQVVFEGKLVKDTLTGKVTFPDSGREGTFRLKKDPKATPVRKPGDIEAGFAKHKADFDYLLGDCAFTASSKEFDRFRGYWSAVKLDEGRILDEYRVAGDASTWRIRYFNIKPDSLSWAADRSIDGGKTWVKDFQTIEARRIGPPQTMGALAPARKGG